ncbi:nodulation protein G [Arthrobacter sp. Hiyo8]|nr:nodulation protein G [Arthrobacter sp. Hiyo8]
MKPHHALVSKILPGMRERRWGRILAIGSSGVVAPLPNLAVSNTGRAALAGYLKTLAAEVALDAVTVNMILPGRIATDRVAELDRAAAKRRGTTPEEIQLESRKTIPARRYGEPEEFGAAASFLCSAPLPTSPASRFAATGPDPEPLGPAVLPNSPNTQSQPLSQRMTMTSTATESATSARQDVAAAQHLINGEWTGEPEIQRINPARPDELAALSPRGTADDVDAAITAAAAAQPAWAALPAPPAAPSS